MTRRKLFGLLAASPLALLTGVTAQPAPTMRGFSGVVRLDVTGLDADDPEFERNMRRVIREVLADFQ